MILVPPQKVPMLDHATHVERLGREEWPLVRFARGTKILDVVADDESRGIYKPTRRIL